ncbi:hypothetical protein AYO44_06630 [Planctomycetaceae bacterium SCGC AG-212-F19]|nr:hypothetical protein AYO44_06630 [Planctomycetaceae bacterium SCGC AG-212-F19]
MIDAPRPKIQSGFFELAAAMANGRTIIRGLLVLLAACLLMLAGGEPWARAYIDVPPQTLGRMCSYSTDIAVLRVEKVDKQKRVILFRKVQVLKGDWPGEIIRHAVAKEMSHVLDWAEPGKTALTFYVKTDHIAGYTYIDKYWYVNRRVTIDAKVVDDRLSWIAEYAQPLQLRTYSGKPENLTTAISAILKGEEVVVPCMVADNNKDLAEGRAKVQKLRASLKRVDYNVKRDAAE